MQTQPSQAPIYGLYGENGDTAAPFDLHCETITARSSSYRFEIGQHRHRSFLQLLLVEAGEGDAILEDGVHRLGPASLVMIPPMYRHGFRFAPTIEGLVVTLDAQGPACREVLSGPLSAWFRQGHVLSIPGDADGELLRVLLRHIESETGRRRPDRQGLLDSLVKSALIMAARIGLDTGDQATGDPVRERLANDLLALVDRHYREHRPAAFYAEGLGISAATLNRFCHARFGMATHDLLSRRVIDQACRNLVFTQLPVREIASQLGYDDPAYFYRIFRQRIGMTPKTYRNEQRLKRSF